MATEIYDIDSEKSSAAARAAEEALRSDEHELPVLPEVSIQLLQLTADVDCDPRDIVNLFKRDQSLTGHLLKIANSARYNSGQSVISIQQAVARLGLLRVREIVVLISCQSKVFKVQGFEQDVRRSFEKSLATAAFAQELARVRRLNVEDAFLCGLLHDVGRPVLLQSLSDGSLNEGNSFEDDELRAAVEAFRIPMAGKLIRSWELPERLALVVEHQAVPLEAVDYEQQAAILRFAVDLAELALDATEEIPAWLTHPMMDVLNLYPEDVAGVVSQQNKILEWVRSTR